MADDNNSTTDDEGLSTEDARIAELLRSVTVADTRLESPPPDVWAGIESKLAAEDRPDIGEVAGTGASTTNVVDLGKRRRRRLPVILSAAAAVIIGVLAVVVASTGDDESLDTVASAELVYASGPGFDPLGDGASAEARLVEDSDGSRLLVVEQSSLPTADAGFYEVWLLAPNAEGGLDGLVSLGVMEGSESRFAVPAGLDPAVYSAVDISIEPVDGDPAHSGRSLVRGGLA